MAKLALLLSLLEVSLAEPPWAFGWARISTWCFPHFAPLPLDPSLLQHIAKFDMINLCAPGLVHHPNGTFDSNVFRNVKKMMKEVKAVKPSARLSPYIGFELGQSWYEAQAVFNTDPWCEPLWLKYKNGSAVTCDDDHPSFCEMLQKRQPNAKVYDWRVPGMVEYFLANLTGMLFHAEDTAGVFYDDIYMICDYVQTGEKRGYFEEGAGAAFCEATFAALERTADEARRLGKVAILSVKGDETDGSPFNMTRYEELVVRTGAMAYFEWWSQWVGQPRNEHQLEYAIRWGQLGVPMQMHGASSCRPGDGNFSLAMFLVAAGEHSYYSTGHGWSPRLDQALWLPEYEKPLGRPKGPAKKVAEHVWQREFQHLTVHLDMGDCNRTRLLWGSTEEIVV